MAKKSRSKQKKGGSRSGCKIITQDSDSEILNEIVTQDSCQIIIQDSDNAITTQDSDNQVTRDYESLSFDCFNEDGILSLILSKLSLKEAVRTCVLSGRWNHVWRNLPMLNFNVENIFDEETLEHYETIEHYDSFLTEVDKFVLLLLNTEYFIQTVNSILQQHQGHVRVDTINIIYFLYKAHSLFLDELVRFAVASKARVLCLDLRQPHSTFEDEFDEDEFEDIFEDIFRDFELYDFPLHLLTSSSIKELYLVCCTLKPPYECLNRLLVLSMSDVGDTGEDINHLVSHCTSLLRLVVMGSKELVSLSIPYSLSKLHSLTVENCDRLTEIKINAENVDEFFYEGVPVDFTLRQPSCLVKAKICFKTEGSDHNLNFYLTKLAKDLPYLQFLTLKINDVFKVENWSKCSPNFIHLKLLDWAWSDGVKMSHLHLNTLLDAAPFLEELKLRLSNCGVEEPRPRLTKLKKTLPKHPHPHLKTIEISGFSFLRCQVEIVLYLLINATKLESMTLLLEKGPESVKNADMKSLAQQVPPNVKLVIL